MKRIWILWIVLSLLVFTGVSESESFSFTDDSGCEVVVKKKTADACVLFSSYAEMWIMSGGTVSMTVGESVERGFADKNTPLCDSGAGKKVDLEAIVYNRPSLIIGSLDIPAHREARDTLSAMNIPFALFKVESIEDYLRVFRIMTRINQNEEAYQKYGISVYDQAQDTIQKAQSLKETEKMSVLFIRSGSGYSSAKAKTADMHFAAGMLEDIGAYNIADDVKVILDGLSFEEIYEKDPDAIFISLMGDEEAARGYMQSVLNEPTWQALTAVQNGRCYFLKKDLYQFKPNHRWALAYEEMARMLYPQWENDETEDRQ